MVFMVLPDDHPALLGYMRPEMMAIGDSVFNGTRSLTTGPALARLSPPAMVARGLRISDFRVPDYPRPVLFDLEDELRRGLNLSRLRDCIMSNADAWLQPGAIWSRNRFFDNISIAGAAYGDLHENTAGAYRLKAQLALAAIKAASSLDFKAVQKLYYALNVAFLLNPTNDPDLDDLTPLEQVATRKPKRLLVNIGSNEGLFRAGIGGSYNRAAEDGIGSIPALAEELGAVLARHCGAVEHIYFNLLLRPRTLANLAPRTDEEMFDTPADGGYFSEYLGRIGALGGMSGVKMAAFDDFIKQVNRDTASELIKALGPKLHIVDLYSLSDSFDRKHFGDARSITVRRGNSELRMSNLPITSFLGGHGGIFSLDNMHPSTVGYALLANKIGNEVAAGENLAYAETPAQAAYDADTLLLDKPGGWDLLNFVAAFAANFFHLEI